MKRLIRKVVFAGVCAAMPLAGPAAGAEMPMLELSVGVHRIEVEVASNGPSREEGLMFRRQLGPGRGMLFVFPAAARHCMWMRNTYLPLSVAFLDEQGAILNVEDMQPQTEDSHCAAKPARFALEMNLGWFEKRGIGSGQRISGIDRAPAPR